MGKAVFEPAVRLFQAFLRTDDYSTIKIEDEDEDDDEYDYEPIEPYLSTNAFNLFSASSHCSETRSR